MMGDGLRYTLRALWFALKVILISALVLGGVWYCFFTALNIGDTFIVVTDGMRVRASIALTGEDDYELDKYFSDVFLVRDEVLNSGAYEGYDIIYYDYRIKIKWISCGPASDKATVTAVETVDNITVNAGEGANNVAPPAWENNTYDIILKKDKDGRWLIDGLTAIGPAEERESSVELVE